MPQRGAEPFLHSGAAVRNCALGTYVEVGEGMQLLESVNAMKPPGPCHAAVTFRWLVVT
jgi:hypothetical protein